jgi:hypothetical protein
MTAFLVNQLVSELQQDEEAFLEIAEYAVIARSHPSQSARWEVVGCEVDEAEQVVYIELGARVVEEG